MVTRKNLIGTRPSRAIAQENERPRPPVSPWIGSVEIEEGEDPILLGHVRRNLIAQAKAQGEVRSQLDGIIHIPGPKPIPKVLQGSRNLTERGDDFSQHEAGESIAEA